MQLINKYDAEVRYLWCFVGIYNKYEWFFLWKRKMLLRLLMNLIKSWLRDSDIDIIDSDIVINEMI